MIKNLVTTIICIVLLACPAAAQNASNDLPALVGARVSTTADKARLVVDLADTTQFALASLLDPMQIAVDMRASAVPATLDTTPAGEGIIKDFKVEMAEEGRARVWLSLSAPAKVNQAYFLEAIDDQPARLVVDIVTATAEEFSHMAAQDLQTALARLEPAAQTPKSDEKSQPAARPLIILDPGHGGADSGAEAANGVMEKHIVLAFAKHLRKLLVATGKFDVAMTREDDTFLKLEERVAIARQNKADLFISIHADSFQQDSVRGASIYTRDENATDVLDKVLADKENRADIIAGFAVPRMQDGVVSILVDLMRREMRRQSYRAAQDIVAELKPSVRLRRFPLRKADFFVLQAPDVPSILLELGFLSNVKDSNNLTTDEWRDEVAGALTRGITRYFEDFKQP